jgi:hypothetical protein
MTSKVNFGDQRAGGVNDPQVFASRHLSDGRRNAVRTEDDRCAVGHFVQFVDEDDAPLSELLHDEAVVDDFLAHIDGRRQQLQGLLHDVNGTDDARTETAWRRKTTRRSLGSRFKLIVASLSLSPKKFLRRPRFWHRCLSATCRRA